MSKHRSQANLTEIVVGVDFGGNGSGHSFVARGYDHKMNVYGLMSVRHMNKDFPKGIDANILSDLILEFVDKVQIKYGNIDYVYWDNAETVLGQTIKMAIEDKYEHIIVKPAWKLRIKDRIDCTVRLSRSRAFFCF